ncbi:MAG: EthD family reductase [Deltaproteobacteria bacterium]|nr:EthD family reductase [Deltaproteobacteria bacterium]
MVKLIFFCRRRSDITHERYAELLLGSHVPLALKHHPTLRRYVVNIVEHSPPGETPLDSVGELTFDSLEDFRQRLYDSPEGRRVIAHDVKQFMGGASAYVTSEHIQKGGDRPEPVGTCSPGVKMVCPLRRRAGMSHAAFVDHWLGVHVPLALRHHPGMSKYVTNVVEARLDPNTDEIDGVAELHFPSRQTMTNGLFDSPAGEEVVRADIERFIGHTFAYVVAEFVQRSRA